METMEVIDTEKEPRFAKVFLDQPTFFNVKSDHSLKPFLVCPLERGDEVTERLQAEFADEIAKLLIQEEGLEKALERLEAMANDPGELIHWKDI